MKTDNSLLVAISQILEHDKCIGTQYFELRIPQDLQRTPGEETSSVWRRFAENQPAISPEQNYRMLSMNIVSKTWKIACSLHRIKKFRPLRNPLSRARPLEEIVGNLSFEYYAFHESVEKLQRAVVPELKSRTAQDEFIDFLKSGRKRIKSIAKELLTYRGLIVHSNDSQNPFKEIDILAVGVLSELEELEVEYVRQQSVSAKVWKEISVSLEIEIAKFLLGLLNISKSMVEKREWKFIH